MLIQKLREYIHSDFIYAEDKGKSITLKEGKTSKCKDFSIEKGNYSTITLEIDKDGMEIHPLFKDGIKNLKKKTDYLIFCEKKSKEAKLKTYYALSVELKSDNPDDWHRQANAGRVIAQYLVGIVENKEKQKLNVEYRCLLFHTKKETSKIRKKKKIKHPKTEYEKHPIFGYLFADRPCNINHFLENLIG